MPAKISVDTTADLTVVEISEPFTKQDFFDAFSNQITRHFLLCLTDMTDFHNLTPAVLEEISRFSATFDHLRPNGRSAFVLKDSIQLSIASLYAAISTTRIGRTVEIKPFTDRETALAWLMQST